jgi:hypothetical protein
MRKNDIMSTGHWLTLRGDRVLSLPLQITSIAVVTTITIPIMMVLAGSSVLVQTYTKIKQLIKK